jgi:hypothetical protein
MQVFRFCISVDEAFIVGCDNVFLDIWFLRFQDKVIVLDHQGPNSQGCVTS